MKALRRMSYDLALRLIEIGIGLALIQRGVEHLGRETWVFAPQIALAVLLVAGVQTGLVVPVLWLLGVVQLARFNGPVNGGSDKMAMLILFCLSLAHLAPDRFWAEMALSYLAVQLVLSYVVSGWVKLRNPAWRLGGALEDVFAVSAYPTSDGMRALSDRRAVMRVASWAVIGFECLFPLALLHPLALAGMLCVTAGFHLANAVCFGLNRFFWVWIAAYPSVLWFQTRLTGQGVVDLF